VASARKRLWYTGRMTDEPHLRAEVIARLMSRHGLSVAQAEETWRRYLLQLRWKALKNAQGSAEDN